MTNHNIDQVIVGAIWTHKNNRYRKIVIRGVTPNDYVEVDRNTSRRKQPISIKTLLREYRPERA